MASSEECFTDRRPVSDDGGKTRFTDDIDVLDIVDFPCLVHDPTMEFLRSHGRVLFLSRGPPGSGKGTVASRLHELYPGSRLYWSDKMFLTPAAPARTKEMLAKSHVLCKQKIAEYMMQNVPVIINRNTNMMVWEVSQYLQLAATYGYTVIILDINRNFILEPQVLAITNSKGLTQEYIRNRMKQWEHVYPFATGWSPRPRDAALLLRRYKKLAANLANDSSNYADLKPVQNTQVFPFCLARVCWFGWDEENRNYWHSEQVKKAYGSKDTISVLGYAIVGSLVTAVVELTNVQAALAGDSERAADWNAVGQDAKDMYLQNAAASRFPTVLEFNEMQCTLDLDKVTAPDIDDKELEEASAYRELPPPSQVSFIILGSTSTEPITYSKAVRSCASLNDSVLSWRNTPDAQARMDIGGFVVYSANSESSCPLLVLDQKTVKVEVVFTGYYQPHTTRLSARCPTWSSGHTVAAHRERFLQGGQPRASAMRYMQATGDHDTLCLTDSTKPLERVDAPCLRDEKTQHFLRSHGRLLLLVRGPLGSCRDIVATELEKLYPDSCAYWSDKLFSLPTAPERNTTSIRESHELCLNKIEAFMKSDTAVIINKNPNIMVWEVANFLVLASRYGYTVISINMPHQVSSDLKVASRAKQWEEVHPFAMGWSPRPKDAAQLLQCFKQLRAALHEENPIMAPEDVSTSHVFPFCLAKLCLFGRTTEGRDYCKTEKVRKAYGRSDTLQVFGYGVAKGFVFALVALSHEQASLCRDDGDTEDASLGKAIDDMEALQHRFTVSLNTQHWEEVSCIVDLAKFSPKCDDSNQGNTICWVGDKISFKDVNPSRVTFMPLGTVKGTEYSYSEATAAPWALLSSKLHCWTTQSTEGVSCAKRVAGIDVYGCTGSSGDALLLLPDATVELEAVFTGYYYPYTTELSRCTWSQARSTASGRLPRRRGNSRPFARFQ